MKNDVIRIKARAKVNLALHVTGQRLDGLHLLDSLVAFPDYGDDLFFERADEISLCISGPYGSQLSNDTKPFLNSIIRAARLLNDDSKGVKITLIKNLPLASGIGGGSSNAASTLKVLSRLWQKKMPRQDDVLSLGSDVPVCLSNRLQRMQGIGEKLTTLTSPIKMWAVLANPGIEIATKKIFGLLKNKENNELEPFFDLTNQETFFRYLCRQRNDLEGVVCDLFPEVKEMLSVIKSTNNCQVCRMSGSGATCFGLYIDQECAIKAAKTLKESVPKAWVVSAPLFSIDSGNNVIG